MSNCSHRGQCNEMLNGRQCKYFHHPVIHTARAQNSVTALDSNFIRDKQQGSNAAYCSGRDPWIKKY